MTRIPTTDDVYDKLQRLDPDKWAEITRDDISISDTGAVRVKGKFVKGFSGNTAGRPKKKRAPTASGSGDLTKEEVQKFGKNAKKALEHMLETASSRKEVKEISKILISYQAPKLSNIESRSFEEKTIEIKWADGKDMIDITPEQYKLQQEAAKQIEDSSDIEEIKEEKGKKVRLKKGKKKKKDD